MGLWSHELLLTRFHLLHCLLFYCSELLNTWLLQQGLDLHDAELEHLQVPVKHTNQIGLGSCIERRTIQTVLLHYFVDYFKWLQRLVIIGVDQLFNNDANQVGKFLLKSRPPSNPIFLFFLNVLAGHKGCKV